MDEKSIEINRQSLVRGLIGHLEDLSLSGVTHLAKGSRSSPAKHGSKAKSKSESKAAKSSSTGRQEQDRESDLAALSQKVAACMRCEELCHGRTQTVFGVGDPRTRLCFLGEAPGADEDRLGEPFVGKAGQLLTKIIEACNLKREDVYIFNVLKCRPPENRTPTPEEAENCWEFLSAQIDIIKPEFICCLGAVAARTLLKSELTIGKLRGKVHRVGQAKVICTYHPSYLLRNPPAKKDTWEDMKFLLKEMGLPIPS